MSDLDNAIITVDPVFASDAGVELRILLYVDEEGIFTRLYPLTLLRRVLDQSKAKVGWADRSAPISKELLAHYHEVWFFLGSKLPGGELTAAECLALREWMDRGGGVLITGDHANLVDGEFVGIGQAIGRRVPRARGMRAWNDKPGLKLGAVNTTEIAAGRREQSSKLEADATPQRLVLPSEPGGEPHVLFLDTRGDLLDRLPDHSHEGRVRSKLVPDPGIPEIPAYVDEWKGEAVRPRIVARGIDWRRGKAFPVMSVWDGHTVPSTPETDGARSVCGRIVADSSWHHYADPNLVGIATTEGAAADWIKIQTLFVNLAAWLAPPEVRRAFRERACKWAGTQPDYVVRGVDRKIGRDALPLLARRLPGAWFHDLIPDLLVEHRAADLRAKMPAVFGEVLMGSFMRRLMSKGGQAVELEHEDLRPAAPGLIPEAIAAFEDERRQELARWQQFRDELRDRG